MSWDAIKGIRQGEQQAKASERAKKRGAALARGAGGRKSKTRFTRAEGRASLNRGGRGIAIQNQKSVKGGKGLRGVIDYALNPEKSPELIYSNCGQNAKMILRTMQKFASLRPDIDQERQVGHITLSLPPRVGKVDSKLWAELIQSAREKLGLDDSFACAAVRHGDRAHDHLHLLFCRVSVNGKVHDKANIGLRCTATEALLEKRFNLEMVPEEEFKTRGHIPKGEIEKAIKPGGTLPPRFQIAAALKIALQGRPDVRLFAERLQAAGVGLRANIASTGKMNGFSFTYEGIAFSGSKISKEFGWEQLSERLDYDPANEDSSREFLVSLDGNPGSASRDLANAIATINGLDLAVARVDPTTPDIAAAAGRGAPAADRASELLNKNSAEGNQRAEATTDRADRADRDAEPVPNRVPDHLSELAEPADLPNHQTASLTATPTTTGDSQNGYDHYHPQLYSQQPANLASAPALADLPNLSACGLVCNPVRGEVVLQDHAPGELANRPDRPDRVLQRSAGTSAGREKIARPAASIRDSNKLPSGFVSQRPLDLSQQGWVASLPNRIMAARSTGQRIMLVGLLDARDRVAAIKSNAGYSFPDLKIIDDEQLTALLVDAGSIEQPIRITGTPDFCQRVDTLAKANNLVVTHDHQITEAERQAAERRYQQRLREEQQHRAEAPAPRPS